MIKPSWAGYAAGAMLLLGCASSHDKEVESPKPQQAEGQVAQGGAVESTSPRVGAEVGEAPKASLADLTGVEWRWSRFNDPVAGGLDVSNPEDYSIVVRSALLGLRPSRRFVVGAAPLLASLAAPLLAAGPHSPGAFMGNSGSP